jgi:hypothetical protein
VGHSHRSCVLVIGAGLPFAAYSSNPGAIVGSASVLLDIK